ncbi:hypothetical protein AKJ36_00860 [candidate division MSBL1 archaeon SCGC-AAA259I07]|uniref:ABC transporter domain-containing protein n=1 Tax=candidate division MSBL1 archaeon SCGC-AAA259I07 TaxID=1698266 RepID=A0A133UMB7_9EURY|nr:hypothetical protein AKJ36_00860 [candidate division MSBL1 archaeon SCGC-AAA259I07]
MEKIFSVENLTAGYGKIKIIRSLNLNLEKGENILVTTGPNGAGKSTFLKTIMGVTNIFSGNIYFKGKEITGLKSWETAESGISFLPQENNLFSHLSVRENLEVSCLNPSKKEELMDLVYDLFPSLENMENRQAKSLSGGESKMLAIGSTLMMDPEIMLLDEPCSGVQPSITNEIRKKVSSLEEMKIIWVVIEDHEEVFQYADKCFILSSGEQVFIGDPGKALEDKIVEKATVGE